MTGADLWRLNVALKRHYNQVSNKNVVETGMKGLSITRYKTMWDVDIFERVAKRLKTKKNGVRFLYANMMYDDSLWVSSMTFDPYAEYRKRVETLRYRFKQDLDFFTDSPINEILHVNGNNYPPVVVAYMKGYIMLETVVVLDCLCDFMDVANKKVTDNLQWPVLYDKIVGSKPIVGLEFKKKPMTSIVIERERLVNG